MKAQTESMNKPFIIVFYLAETSKQFSLYSLLAETSVSCGQEKINANPLVRLFFKCQDIISVR